MSGGAALHGVAGVPCLSVELVIPVLNEESQLEACVRRLLSMDIPAWPENLYVIIADNGSDDGTAQIGRALADNYEQVSYLRLEERGRGGALKRAWLRSRAPILAYMDVDLSADLAAFPRLLAPLLSTQADVATGCRNAPGAHVFRGWKRTVLSHAYVRIARAVTSTRIRDLQCGFKAITRKAAEVLLPMVEDTGWFFDTELLLIAEHLGYRIHEEPLTWTDDPDSRVRLLRTAWEDWKGLLRVRRALRRDSYRNRANCKVHAAS